MGTFNVEITIKRQERRHTSKVGNDVRPRIPRITRLMALAIKFQDMVDRGEVRDYADIARLGLVTRARLTQIMNLLLLAPDIQEHLLSASCSSEVRETRLRVVASDIYWLEQRRRFKSGLASI